MPAIKELTLDRFGTVARLSIVDTVMPDRGGYRYLVLNELGAVRNRFRTKLRAEKYFKTVAKGLTEYGFRVVND
jgi:hypothetical protein